MIVQLNNRMKKTKLIKNSEVKKLAGIYVNEYLTRHNHQLLNKATESKGQKLVEFVLCKEGTVFIRKNKDSPAVKIMMMEEIEKYRSNQEGRTTRNKGKQTQLKDHFSSQSNQQATKNQ